MSGEREEIVLGKKKEGKVAKTWKNIAETRKGTKREVTRELGHGKEGRKEEDREWK